MYCRKTRARPSARSLVAGFDPAGELSHIRVENRLLPAGPTVKDIVADAALYYGLVKALSNQTRPVWSRLTFDAANRNFLAGAKHGINAEMEWPTLGSVSYKHLTLTTIHVECRSRWSPYH